MAYCRLGAVEGGMIDGVPAPGLGLDLTQWATESMVKPWLSGDWQPAPLVTSGATPSPLATTGTDTSSVPPLLERPAEKGGGFPWLLLAGLGLVAYVMVKK